MNHTPECIKSTETATAKQKAWVEKWTNYCKKCDAIGGFYFAGTRDDPPDFDTCECVEAGICPRCGQKGIDENGNACTFCGWNWGKNTDDYLPSVPECDCGEPTKEELEQLRNMVVEYPPDKFDESWYWERL